jgi:hypothetical protein
LEKPHRRFEDADLYYLTLGDVTGPVFKCMKSGSSVSTNYLPKHSTDGAELTLERYRAKSLVVAESKWENHHEVFSTGRDDLTLSWSVQSELLGFSNAVQ